MKLKTVNIKGKEYVEVNERLIYFRKTYPKFSLTTDVVEKTDQSITILASILNEEGRVIANGIAEEIKGSTFINKTSYVENCETSAWGRALANFGIGIDSQVCSYEEVANAKLNQDKPKEDKPKEDKPKAKVSSKTPPKKATTIVLDIGDNNWERVLKYVIDNKSDGLSKIIKTLETKYQIANKVKTEIKKHL
jgi:hypothetical protein